MATQLKPVPFTPEQYLEIQRTADVRSKYLSGEMLALAAPSRTHGIIVMNVAGALTGPLRNTNRIGNVGIAVAAPASLLIPDLVVYCGGGDFTDQKRSSVIRPWSLTCSRHLRPTTTMGTNESCINKYHL